MGWGLFLRARARLLGQSRPREAHRAPVVPRSVSFRVWVAIRAGAWDARAAAGCAGARRQTKSVVLAWQAGWLPGWIDLAAVRARVGIGARRMEGAAAAAESRADR